MIRKISWGIFVLLLSSTIVLVTTQAASTCSDNTSLPPAVQIQCGDCFPRQCQSSKYRTYDGSCNNQLHPTWGMANTRNARLIPAEYADGIFAPKTSSDGSPLPLARTLSYMLSPDVRILDKKLTLAAMHYGQFITHDVSLTDGRGPSADTQCCSLTEQLIVETTPKPLCYPLIIPEDDPFFQGRQCQNSFLRTLTDLDRGCPTRNGTAAEQLTTVSQYMDLSVIYSSDVNKSKSLREMTGGRFKVVVRNNQVWLPSTPNAAGNCTPSASVCYDSGDARTNQNAQLTAMTIIWVREHNRVAGILAGLNPTWSDETIYQETRRLLVAVHQQITFYEWLPHFLGLKNSHDLKIIYNTTGYVNDYNSSVDPAILNEHTTGAFRFYHTSIAAELDLVDEQRCPFAQQFNMTGSLLNPTPVEPNFDNLLRGLTYQPQEAVDQFWDDGATNLFLNRGSFLAAFDLRAFDIHRSRDHGIASYNKYRQFCGRRPAKKWMDFLDLISLPNIMIMRSLYKSPDDVDLAVGGILEKLVPGTLSGPTFLCIMERQFYKIRVSDRYWFENGNNDFSFTLPQLKEIRKASISRLLCDNTVSIKSMQLQGFVQISKRNPIVNCTKIPSINYNLWKQ